MDGLYFFVFMSAFAIVALSMPTLIRVAQMKRLVDAPGDSRKLHKRSVPTIGGVMVFLSFLLVTMFWIPVAKSEIFDLKWFYMLVAGIALFFVGLKDDLFGLSPAKKLLAHLVLGVLLVHWGGFRIDAFSGLFGIGDIPLWLSYPFSLFVYIVVVNAVNLIDGIDGLAGGIGTLMMLAFSAWLITCGNIIGAIMALAMAGSLVGFLVYNFHPAKIFMGDCGSLVLGLVTYCMATEVMHTNATEIPVALQGISTPLFAMSILAYPLVDTLRVFTLRASRGKSPFSPDRNHLHHRIMMNGKGHASTSLILYAFALTFMAIPFIVCSWLPETNATTLFAGEMILAFGVFLPILRKTRFTSMRHEVVIKEEHKKKVAISHALETSADPQADERKSKWAKYINKKKVRTEEATA